MKILVVADEECRSLWNYYSPEKLKGVDLIIGCGDLKADYLEFLMTMANVPVYYVRGNHDSSYVKKPPLGCICIDDKVVTYKGVRIMGQCIRFLQVSRRSQVPAHLYQAVTKEDYQHQRRYCRHIQDPKRARHQ